MGCGYGCKPLPQKGDTTKCDFNGAWQTNANGTISTAMDGHCLTLSGGAHSAVVAHSCIPGAASQRWKLRPTSAAASADGSGASFAIVSATADLCVDNHYA